MLVVGKEGRGRASARPLFLCLTHLAARPIGGPWLPGRKMQDMTRCKMQDAPDRKLDISHRKGTIEL